MPCLPLRLFGRQELVENRHVLLQAHKPIIQLLAHSRLVIAQLGVKVLSVGRSAHGGGKDGLDDEGVVLLEGLAVCFAEGV